MVFTDVLIRSNNTGAVELLHNTIRKQLSMGYDRTDYESCLRGLFTYTTRELFEMGSKFQREW